jgi:hypothetical protein
VGGARGALDHALWTFLGDFEDEPVLTRPEAARVEGLLDHLRPLPGYWGAK